MPRQARRVTATIAFVLGAVGGSRPASAQVHWDAGAELGVAERLTTGRDRNASAPTPGPVGELHAHVALVPMVRVGGYVAYDISPVPGLPAREVVEAGLRAKLTPPLLSGPWRDWLFLGIGYARAYAAGAAGGILDLPVGVGIGCKVRRPWEIFAELEGRVGLAFTGALYRGGEAGPSPAPYGGHDSFAVSLSLGVSWDE